VPMRQEGIDVRPIAQVDGSAEFNEVFFTNARCAKDNVVGGVNNGWAVAMDTLGFERGTSATTGHRRFQKELDSIIEAARRNGKAKDPLVRQGLAQAWSKVKIMQINGLRTLTSALNDDRSTLALGATNKMYWSEYHRDTMDLAIDILGMKGQILTGAPAGESGEGDDAGDFMPGIGNRHQRPGYPVSPLQASFFFSRSETIWGGTAQIQRNIVGERVLGLPKEPKPAG